MSQRAAFDQPVLLESISEDTRSELAWSVYARRAALLCNVCRDWWLMVLSSSQAWSIVLSFSALCNSSRAIAIGQASHKEAVDRAKERTREEQATFRWTEDSLVHGTMTLPLGQMYAFSLASRATHDRGDTNAYDDDPHYMIYFPLHLICRPLNSTTVMNEILK